ncbi:acyl-CoA dehydrogenase family protein [Nocardioides litoris]|uniref:acyl-CoA dehydrogenase family protein n=1 Tax=Nocardioides litoris TaxID=1926648 RepID=UPI001124735F|nr:acyl-CoA dehydrogenase family protein [Nocardioides litoris]
MELALTEEQTELVATVRSLLAKRGDARATAYDEGLWQTLCEQIGVAALGIPEEHDGAGFSLFEALLVLEELGRACVPSPLLSSLVVSEALLAGGDDAARARLLPRLAAGEVASYDDGSGRPVADADVATLLLAGTPGGLVEVDPTTARATRRGTVDQTLHLADLDLSGATTTPAGDAAAAAERAALVQAAGVAALATGLSARALEATVAYSKDRVQFGRPIGSFQALKHRMADLHVLVEMSRSASWTASWSVSSRADDAAHHAHVAAAYCTDAALRVTGEAIQLHGGIAITWEHDAHLWFKRAHALTQLAGSPREHRARVEV